MKNRREFSIEVPFTREDNENAKDQTGENRTNDGDFHPGATGELWMSPASMLFIVPFEDPHLSVMVFATSPSIGQQCSGVGL